ncbi:prepilin-type N-terminal cleavage/methylation domain-containing protein [Vitreoscilla massiliensis]|uniref:Prepilin-type N-terminal cleavage/methylation domain-containing protein n=1 Tax=Vitreoscilla massiliensis TaxID=1689272 RepID=A0ABY4E2Z1_9NEIS|nr:type IV pilin protein [Vitreoscilla massiliensis]UOO90144.1 prepilin-type N-terminal cleavage/methylation domain-containing protein [Vitreoscilla massiliensis]
MAYQNHTIFVATLGFTLLESMVVVAIITILAVIVAPTYHQHVLNARLKNAKTTLVADAQYLERYYAQNARFTKNATTWPILPYLSTEYFNISFKGTARGAAANTYRLQAVAKDTVEEPRYLTIDQNHTIQECEKIGSSTRCYSPE